MKELLFPVLHSTGVQISPELELQITRLVNQIAFLGDGPSALPKLLLLIEPHASKDVIPLLAPAVLEDATYRGLTSVFAEAWETAETSDDKTKARINLVKLHLVRADSTTGSQSKRALDNAATTLSTVTNRDQDWQLVELQADIFVRRGKLSDAITQFRRIPITVRPSGEIQAKIARAHRLSGNLPAAQITIEAAIRRESARSKAWYDLQQEQGWLMVAKGDIVNAGKALVASAALTKTKDIFPMSMALAAILESKGRSGDVTQFIADILKWNPNLTAKDLRDALRK